VRTEGGLQRPFKFRYEHGHIDFDQVEIIIPLELRIDAQRREQSPGSELLLEPLPRAVQIFLSPPVRWW
jgi:hypothetical protein